MSGLVAYESSDDEEDPGTLDSLPAKKVDVLSSLAQDGTKSELKSNGTNSPAVRVNQQTTSKSFEGPLAGPILGPSLPPTEIDNQHEFSNLGEEQIPVPLSPYSTERALVHQLTLPPIPNLDIPTSPAGSLNVRLNEKFAHFLNLKKKGIHFNENLTKTAAIKNPSLMQRLMDFAKIPDEEGHYATTLPKHLWDPENFPEWAYKEALTQSQKTVLAKRENEKIRGQRESVDFVPATVTSGESSRSGTPGVSGGRNGPKSAAERVMAGLERGKPPTSVQAGVKRKTRFDG